MAQKEKSKIEDKASASVVAEINRQRKAKGLSPVEIGANAENAGGGTPASGGGRGSMHTDGDSSNQDSRDFLVFDNPDSEGVKEAKEAGIAVRYEQPRKANGEFDYNASNAKKLSTKKSRGKRTPEWLRGVDLTFFTEGSEFKTELGRTLASTTYTADELVEACKVYLDDERGFAGLVGTAIAKKGRESKTSKDVEQGKSGNVDTSKLSQNTQNELAKAAANKPKSVDFTYKPQTKKENNKGKVDVTGIIKKKEQKENTNNLQKETVKAGTSNSMSNQSINSNQTTEKNTFSESEKQSIKQNPKQWVSQNKENIKKVMQKHPKATAAGIVNAIYSGKVKSWDELLK